MNLDVELCRRDLVLEERNLTLLDDQIAQFPLVHGRVSLQVRIWQDAAGLVIVAGPYMDHAMTARWRGRITSDRRWHRAELESNHTRQPWVCRYRIFQPATPDRRQRRPSRCTT